MPTGVASNVKQRICIAIDCSTSMEGDKISEVNLAVKALVAELGIPENKDGFWVSVIAFNHASWWLVEDISAVGANIPEAHASGGTNFDSPLIKVGDSLEAAKFAPNPHHWTYFRPFFLFLSDGHAKARFLNRSGLPKPLSL